MNVVCPSCGQETPAGFPRCANCGASLTVPEAAREERKVVTVLFADLVGFTARAERLDPEEVRALQGPYWQRVRLELERHGGTVEKFIGDAVMALFGAPLAHEDDPERAVRAALAIRDWARDEGGLEIRIGITTGEALVSLSASPERGEGMASGDVVNTASRLQAAAQTNGVLVDETTYRATQTAIEYGQSSSFEAKGKAERVRVWEPLQATSRFGVDVVQAGAPLVGRRRELDLLVDALARSREEGAPQLVTLVGVPGIGKSRLVYELWRAVDAEPELVYWRQGRSLPYGEAGAYWALTEMVKAHTGVLESDSPVEAEGKLAQGVAALGLEGDQIVESLRPLVGLTSDDPAAGRPERFAAWRRFLEALAEERSTVLVFEDLHWADDDLLDFVDYLVEWGSGVPLLVVCTARPELLERRTGWGGGKANALTLSLSPLSEEDTARLIASLLERTVLPANVQASLLARAGGNPLYAEQFARLLEETGDIVELRLPENVHGIIAARLDALPFEEKSLLQDAAVLGKVFWRGAVCAIGERTSEQAEASLHALARKEFVRRGQRSSVGGDDEFAFRHLLVRDVAYGQIPRAERAARHERAARWIETLARSEDAGEMLAHHYLEALRLGTEAGVEPSAALVRSAGRAARDAGDHALALGSLAVAARFYESALEFWPADDDERPELVLAYSRSRVDDATLSEEALEDATEGLLRAGKIEAAAEAQARVGGIWLNRGDRAQAVGHLERARALVEDRGPSAAKAYVLQELARLLMMGNEFERAIDVSRESLALAELLHLEPVRARNLNTLGVSRVSRGDRGGLADLERAVEIAGAAHSAEQSAASANLTWMTAFLGDVRRAGELHERTRELARRFGAKGYVDWQEAEHVFHCHWEGRWDEAVATADAFVANMMSSTHYMESACRYIRGAIRLARGDRSGALADGVRATEVARAAQDPQTLNPSLAFEALARLAVGERAGANELADELVASWKESGIQQAHECMVAPWVFLELARREELEAALGRVRASTPWHAAARRVAAGDLAGAADTFHEIGSVPDEAYTRVRAAALADRSAAEYQLAIARPMLLQLGATAWAAEADALLARSA